MEFITIFFVLLSVVVLLYFAGLLYNSSVRIPIILEVFFAGIYFFVLFIFLFPEILSVIEDIFGIDSAVNFLVYLSIFILFFLVFILYKKTEEQRIEITKLVRELSYYKKK